MLHVTNGTSVSLAEAGLGGEILVWLDVLHEGPVPAGIGDEELSRVRGRFLDETWPRGDSAARALQRRDEILAANPEIVLWFEHDLFDQLQLIQILERCSRAQPHQLSLICVDRYLGRLSGAELAALWPARRPVTPGQFALAADAWRAFRSPDPMELQELLARDTTALPFLAGALRRHLEQFPSVENGLSRTESQILGILEPGPLPFWDLFGEDQRREERLFMGDTSLRRHLDGLMDCAVPLAAGEAGRFRITDAGREVLAGRAGHLHLNGIDRWLGGVHLTGHAAPWRWDGIAGKLVPAA